MFYPQLIFSSQCYCYNRFAEFVVQVLSALSELSGADRAAEQFKASGLDLLKTVNAPPREVGTFTVYCMYAMKYAR